MTTTTSGSGNPTTGTDTQHTTTTATTTHTDTITNHMHDSQTAPNPNLEQETTLAKRRAIRQIMSQTSLTEQQKALQIQQLMNGSNPHKILSQLLQQDPNPRNSLGSAGKISSSSSVQPHPLSSSKAASTGGMAAPVPCVHYERKCYIIAPCCGHIFGCRVCHDELTQEEHGPMDRTQVKEIICKECHTRQPCSNHCTNPNCTVDKFAEYHCDKCNLWMGLEKKPFHCEECGLCRVGGRDQYRHCSVCSMCIHADIFDRHICLRDKYKNHCPVCREDMHTSRHAPQDLPCGHAIHAHCFRKLAGFDYRCPVCKKTVMSQKAMAATWAVRAMDIQSQPMPSDLARVVNIMCYDCETKSKDLSWHFLGVQCPSCMSFNTVVEEVVSSSVVDDHGSGMADE